MQKYVLFFVIISITPITYKTTVELSEGKECWQNNDMVKIIFRCSFGEILGNL